MEVTQVSAHFDGAKACALRREAGISVENLAAVARVSPNTVRAAESGAHQPRPRVAAALAAALGVTPRELIASADMVTLRKARFALGLTQAEIAQRIGCSRQLVSRLERGAGAIGAAEKWAAAYELTPDQWHRAAEASRAALRDQVAARTGRERPTGERG